MADETFANEGDRPFDASIYPRVYWLPKSYRVFCLSTSLLGILFIIFSFVMMADKIKTTSDVLAALATVIFFLLGSFYLAFCGLRWRVTIFPDAIEVQGAWWRRRLRYENIVGRKVQRSPNGPPVLVLFSKAGKKFKVPILVAPDIAMRAWVARIPSRE